jgi:flagellar biosynthesis protein FlhG
MSSQQEAKNGGEAPGSATRGGKRVLIAVGAGRGGVGKSLVAVNLSVYLAQLSRAVVLVDADPGDSNLHTQFDLRAAHSVRETGRAAGEAVRDALVPTSVPGLSLLPAAHDVPTLAPATRKKGPSRWLASLRALRADYVVVDVGPGHGEAAIECMLAADIPIAVTVPEPPAIEATYRFLRASFRSRLRKAVARDKERSSLLERMLVEAATLPAPIELVSRLARVDPVFGELAWAEAQRHRMQLVVNQTRLRPDSELGSWMSGLVSRHYGTRLDELGHIEHDDTVWLAVRRNRPLLVDSPASKSARNVERIARRVLALAMTRSAEPEPPSPIPSDEPTLYAVLGVTRTASDEEIRRAYKRQREIYSTGGLATASLLDAQQIAAAQTKLDEAHDTLLDGIRRRAYDLSTFPETEPLVLAARTTRPALEAEQLMLQDQLQREIGPHTEFTGSLLRKVRESQGLELAELSAKTRIASVYLQAIEEEHFELLPALVYTRGFVAEFAKQLRLDPAQVQRTYLRRLRQRLPAAGKELA